MFKKFIEICERIGYARAAHNLALMGKHEEAKALMCHSDKKEVA